MANPIKRQTGVEQDAIWIDCVPEEIAKVHQKQLEYAVEQASAIYRQEAKQQAEDQVRQAESHHQFRSKVEKLGQALYPESVHFSKGYSIITKWFWAIIGACKRKDLTSTQGKPAITEPAGNPRDYHHSRFEGAALSPDGRALMLDYFDHDQGGTRYCFRYVLSAHKPPRLVSGYTHEHSNLDYEIPFERIPHHVLSEAKDWLDSYLKSPQDKPVDTTLTDLSSFLKKHESKA